MSGDQSQCATHIEHGLFLALGSSPGPILPPQIIKGRTRKDRIALSLPLKEVNE